MGLLGEVGLCVQWDVIEGPTPLPGITIDGGTLVVDRAALRHPGDLLHEGGHLAVIPAGERALLAGDAGSDPAREMMAIAWSYAALRHLRLDPAVVFHADGYPRRFREPDREFGAGRYVGVPVLQWPGMTAGPERAAQLGVQPYPKMLRWLV